MHIKNVVNISQILRVLKYSAIIHCCLLFVQISAKVALENFREPHIRLKGYQNADSIKHTPVEDFGGDFEIDTVSKRGSDYVISDGVTSVGFTCEADYPITWTFPFPRQLPTSVTQFTHIRTGEYRISELDPNIAEPVNIRYRTIIKIKFVFLNFLSINLTCDSVESSANLRSSIYIYWKGGNAIKHQDETLLVVAREVGWGVKNSPLPPVIIPCRPATPDMKISLEMQANSISSEFSSYPSKLTRNVWTPLPPQLQQRLSFDPKVGFILSRHGIQNEFFGPYKCSVHSRPRTSDETEAEYTADGGPFVQVVVAQSQDDTTDDGMPSQGLTFPKSIFRGKASAGLQIETDGFDVITIFKCCSGDKANPAKMYVSTCANPVQCKLLQSSFLEDIATGKVAVAKKSMWEHYLKVKQTSNSTDCMVHLLVGCDSTVAVCQGENIDFADHFVNIFHPLAAGSVANRSERIRKADYKAVVRPHHYVSLTRFEPANILEADDNVAQKMMLFICHAKSRKEHFVSRDAGYGLHAYIQDLDIESLYYDSYTTTAGNVDVDISDILENHIVEYNRDYYYEGESLTFLCIGIKFAYEKGAQLTLNWHNGSKTTANDIASKFASKELPTIRLSGNGDMFNGLVRDESLSKMTVVAAIGMSCVDCWMPKRNSRKWDKMSKEIKVLPTVAPVFFEKASEIKYFYVGEVGKVISCRLEKGTPAPSLSVTRNGNKLKIEPHRSAYNKGKPLAPKVGATNQTEILGKNNQRIGIKIKLSAIRHDDHGSEFKCIATNVNRTVARVVTIIVKERPGKTIPVIFGCSGILLLHVAALGVKHWYYKRRVSSLRTNSS